MELTTNLDKRCDELLDEIPLEQAGPVGVDEVDDQALDVGAILVLVGHDHQVTVAQGLEVSLIDILLPILETQDLYHVGDLFILHDLMGGKGLKMQQ